MALRRSFFGKDEALQVANDWVNALEAECKQKNDLIMEVSSMVTKAENAANIAIGRLLSFASILDQVADSSHDGLLAIADLEASLGLAVF